MQMISEKKKGCDPQKPQPYTQLTHAVFLSRLHGNATANP